MSTTTCSVDAIVQEITIKAPAARVFEALTDPTQRMKWWGQEGRFETTNAESDLRLGGRWLMSGMGMARPYKARSGFWVRRRAPSRNDRRAFSAACHARSCTCYFDDGF
jgi:hypothetical protein